MTVMNYFLIACGVGLMFCTYLLVSWWKRYRARQQLRREISHEIDDLVERLGQLSTKAADANVAQQGVLTNTKYLTTLITVLVKKFDGTVQLTEDDFTNCTVDDYISVQYNMDDNSLYLISNRVMPLVTDPADDTTYH